MKSIRWAVALMVVLAACSTAGSTSPSSSDSAGANTSQPGKETGSQVCAPNAQPGTVRVWHSLSGNSSLDILAEFGTEIEKTENLHVEFRRFNGDADTLKALASTGSADWPDIVIVSEQATRSLLDSGRFLHPDDCDAGLADGMLPQVAATYTVDHRLVALPFGVSVPVLIFEAGRFRKAGLDPAHPPRTLPELLSASQTIRDSGVSRYGLVMSDSCGNYLVDQLSAQRGQVLGEPGNGHGARVTSVDLATPETVANLTAVRDALWNDNVKYIGSNPSGFDDLVALTLPQDGAVMTVHTSGAVGDVVSLFDSGNFPGLSLGVAPLPGPGRGSLIGGNALWIHDSGDPMRVGRAWRMLEWLYQPENLARFAVATGYVPVTEAAAAEPALQDEWSRHPVMRVAYDQVLATDVSEATAGLLIGPFADQAAALSQACNDVLVGGADVETALAKATTTVNYLIGQYEAARTGEPPPTTLTVQAAAQPTEVSGRVRCESGAEVVGIWVDAQDGGSGWAERTVGADGTTAFTKMLDRSGKYQLHVGCGGTSDEWATSYFSEYVSVTGLSFVCTRR